PAATASAARWGSRTTTGHARLNDVTTAATALRASTTTAAATRRGSPLRRRRRLPERRVRRYLLSERRTGTTDERDALSVGRPHRAAVEIRARRHEVELSSLHIIQTDERVILTRAHECELRSVG